MKLLYERFSAISKSLVTPIAELFFPARCQVCDATLSDSQKNLGSVCENCWNSVSMLTSGNICTLCGSPIETTLPGKLQADYKCGSCRSKKKIPYTMLRSLYKYDDETRDLIKLFKFQGILKIGDYFGERLGLFVKSMENTYLNSDMIVPVPLFWWKQLTRGYNQSEILANKIASITDIPVFSKALIRTKNRKPQSWTDLENRQKNIKGAFHANRQLCRGKRIILVDDVVTSESTINECCRTLKKAGAKEVLAITVCRAI